VDVDRSCLRLLSRDECVRLLSTTGVGRIAFHSQAVPMILPVAYSMEERGVVVRMCAGSRLDRATRDSVIAFEADDVDPGHGRAWSVAAVGVVRHITDPDELRICRGLGLDGWRFGGTDCFALISLDLVSGRFAAEDVPWTTATEPDTDGDAPGAVAAAVAIVGGPDGKDGHGRR